MGYGNVWGRKWQKNTDICNFPLGTYIQQIVGPFCMAVAIIVRLPIYCNSALAHNIAWIYMPFVKQN